MSGVTCARCGKEVRGHIRADLFGQDVLFCSQACVEQAVAALLKVIRK